MKYLVALLLLSGSAFGQTFHLDAKRSKTHRAEFDPYGNESRTIEFDLSVGTPRITSDVTIPEGVGYIYIYSHKTKRAMLEYSRIPEYQTIRFLQSVPYAPYMPVVPYYGF